MDSIFLSCSLGEDKPEAFLSPLHSLFSFIFVTTPHIGAIVITSVLLLYPHFMDEEIVCACVRVCAETTVTSLGNLASQSQEK